MKKDNKPILGIASKKTDYKYVGVHIPPHIYNFITLYTLAMKIAKSNLFNTLIEDWIELKKQEGLTEENLINPIVVRINHQWKDKKKKNPKSDFNSFKDSLQGELMNKGLSMKQVSEILSLIYGKNEK